MYVGKIHSASMGDIYLNRLTTSGSKLLIYKLNATPLPRYICNPTKIKDLTRSYKLLLMKIKLHANIIRRRLECVSLRILTVVPNRKVCQRHLNTRAYGSSNYFHQSNKLLPAASFRSDSSLCATVAGNEILLVHAQEYSF